MRTEGSTKLYLEFISYENPRDLASDGDVCDMKSIFASGDNFCDLRFTFCVTSEGGR